MAADAEMGESKVQMTDNSKANLTGLLQRMQGEEGVFEEVVPLVYTELKKLARAHLRRESRAGSLETTVLVHEAYLRLAGSHHPAYEDRIHFYGIASRLMRQILVDTARARNAEKRGAAVEVAMAQLPEAESRRDRNLLALDDALRQLEEEDPLKARLIEMRYFGGMTAEECSSTLDLPVHTVRRELRLAQAWLQKEMAQGSIEEATKGA